MVLRKQYLDRLIRLRDKKIIKVVTGVRRCGKSTLLKQFEQYLLENGVVEEQIISIILRTSHSIIYWNTMHCINI